MDGHPSPPSLPKRECYTVGLNITIQYEQGRSVVDCWPHTRYNTNYYPVPTPHVSKQSLCFETTLVTKHRTYTIIKKERKKILAYCTSYRCDTVNLKYPIPEFATTQASDA